MKFFFFGDIELLCYCCY